MAFEGHGDADVVNTYLTEVLFPAIPRGSVVIMDNARFHGAASTADLFRAAGCEQMFLPAYSPDLNPIEHMWAALKQTLRKGLPYATDKFLFIANTCLSYC